VSVEGQDDTDSEFELEFDDVTETVAEADASSDELGGDLGIDFDPDREPLGEGAAAVADEPEADLENELILEEDTRVEFDSSAAQESTEELAPQDPATDEFAATEGADDFEFDSPEGGDINATKLDLAEAYIDMGDADGAQDILKEVVDEGTPEQQQKAQSMLDTLGG
jgi:pilus assembly protein FimV